jgi:membrane fusion protein, heavy metal efflux system
MMHKFLENNNYTSLIISVLVITTLGCNKQTSNEETQKEQPNNLVELTATQLKNTEISLGKLEAKVITSTIKLNGKIDVPPQNLVSVSAPFGGYLKSTKLLPGMHVAKGEIIATLEDQQYVQLQQDYLLAKTKLQYAELEYARQKELNQSQASSDKVTQIAQNEVSTQRIMMNALAEKLKIININPKNITAENMSRTINIRSTITGFVSKINVNIGKYLSPTEVLFELIDPTDIHLNLKVYEKDVNKLAIGQKLMAYSNNNDKKYTCEIILISKDISTEGFVEVHCHFLNFDKTLLPGMYMNAEVELNNETNNTIASDAIVNFEGKSFIFTEKNNKEFEMIEVKTGNSENGNTAISANTDLTNKKIIIKGAYTLMMKLKNTEE